MTESSLSPRACTEEGPEDTVRRRPHQEQDHQNLDLGLPAREPWESKGLLFKLPGVFCYSCLSWPIYSLHSISHFPKVSCQLLREWTADGVRDLLRSRGWQDLHPTLLRKYGLFWCKAVWKLPSCPYQLLFLFLACGWKMWCDSLLVCFQDLGVISAVWVRKWKEGEWGGRGSGCIWSRRARHTLRNHSHHKFWFYISGLSCGWWSQA